MKWSDLTPDQQAQIKKQFKGWKLKDLQRAKWSLNTMQLAGGRTHTSWAADFGTKLK